MTHKAPLELYRASVETDWIDYNGHMNVAYYVLVFDRATDAFLDYLGLDAALRERSGSSTFSVEAHITYQREVGAGDPLRFATQLLGYDEKRIHYIHRMYQARDGFLAATIEWMTLHVNLRTRKVAPLPAAILTRLAELHRAHARLEVPPEVGKTILRPLPPTGPQPFE